MAPTIGRYIPDASGAIYNVLKQMIPSNPSKKIRYGDDLELLRNVSDNLVTKETFSEKLTKHVEQVFPSNCFFVNFFIVLFQFTNK